MGACILEISYPSLYQNVNEGMFTFIDGGESSEEKRKTQPMHIELGFCAGIAYKIVAMNGKVRKCIGAQSYEYNGIFLSVDTIIQKMLFLFLRMNRCL